MKKTAGSIILQEEEFVIEREERYPDDKSKPWIEYGTYVEERFARVAMLNAAVSIEQDTRTQRWTGKIRCRKVVTTHSIILETTKADASGVIEGLA